MVAVSQAEALAVAVRHVVAVATAAVEAELAVQAHEADNQQDTDLFGDKKPKGFSCFQPPEQCGTKIA